VIHVEPAPKPDTFDEYVGKPGNAIVERLLKEYGRSEGIPRKEFRSLWTENRETDGNSVLDDLIDAYGGMCAYLGVYMERTAGCPTVDHYIPLSRDCGKAYDWSNYRLCSLHVNSSKRDWDVVDPFGRIDGWFRLNLYTYKVEPGPKAGECSPDRMERTLSILNLPKCVKGRGEYLKRYWGVKGTKLPLEELRRYAPFVAAELRDQNMLNVGDVWTDSDQ